MLHRMNDVLIFEVNRKAFINPARNGGSACGSKVLIWVSELSLHLRHVHASIWLRSRVARSLLSDRGRGVLALLRTIGK